jgi:hypothetical protein
MLRHAAAGWLFLFWDLWDLGSVGRALCPPRCAIEMTGIKPAPQ